MTAERPGVPAVAEPAQREQVGDHRGTSRRHGADWVGLLARLALGGVMIAAGVPKLLDRTASIQNVLAYELFGYEVSRAIGILLPVAEVALGVLLILGLLTRSAAALTGVLMLVFVAGIVSAWARGLAIDCGCFGTGGPVDPEDTTYVTSIVRDVLFLALAVWLTVRPRTPWSLDQLLTRGR